MRGRIVIAVLVALALVSSVGAGRATAGLNIDFNLIAQPQLVVVPGTPVAYAPKLEDVILPQKDTLIRALRELAAF